MAQQKNKAKRNATITIDADERQQLMQSLVTREAMPDCSAHNGLPADMLDSLILGDAIAAMSKLPDAFADLIILDPPYNLTKEFGQARFSAMSDKDYEDYLRSWMPLVCRKLKPDGSLYLCGDWKSSYSLHHVLAEHLTVINRITWQREKGRGAARNWKNSMEDIWFAVKDPKHYHFNLEAVKQRRLVRAPYRNGGLPKDWQDTPDGKFRDTCPSNFWDDICVPFWSMPENTTHPTQKPEKLYAKLILASSKPGGIVLDPFMGSGTACVVAKKLSRHFIGIEHNPDYCAMAAKRLLMADDDITIQGYSDGVFCERNSIPYQKPQKHPNP